MLTMERLMTGQNVRIKPILFKHNAEWDCYIRKWKSLFCWNCVENPRYFQRVGGGVLVQWGWGPDDSARLLHDGKSSEFSVRGPSTRRPISLNPSTSSHPSPTRPQLVDSQPYGFIVCDIDRTPKWRSISSELPWTKRHFLQLHGHRLWDNFSIFKCRQR